MVTSQLATLLAHEPGASGDLPARPVSAGSMPSDDNSLQRIGFGQPWGTKAPPLIKPLTIRSRCNPRLKRRRRSALSALSLQIAWNERAASLGAGCAMMNPLGSGQLLCGCWKGYLVRPVISAPA